MAPAALPRAQPDVSAASLLAAGQFDPRWSTALGSALLMQPAFDEDAAYLALRDGRLVAVDLANGSERWSEAIASEVPPAAGDGLVFVAGGGQLMALDRRTGARQWVTRLDRPAASPLYWDTGWLIVSLDSGDLLGLRARDGELIWRQPLGVRLTALPAPALDRLYLGLADGRVLAARLDTGLELWSHTLEAAVTGLLALGDQLIVGSEARAIVSLDLHSGRQRWRWRLGAPVLGVPAADAEAIYVVTFDNMVRALARRHGHLRWRQGLPSRPAASPLVVDGHVLVPLVSTELRGYLAATGREAFVLNAAGEAGASPHLRPTGRPTGARLVTITLDGRLQGVGPRVEPVPTALGVLPGTPVDGEATVPLSDPQTRE
jgi:outer membrane protein assembly factor BamB